MFSLFVYMVQQALSVNTVNARAMPARVATHAPPSNAAQENNFKAVLESIRDLMNEDDVVVPDWLHDIFLGYGDPGAAHWTSMPAEGRLTTVNFVVRASPTCSSFVLLVWLVWLVRV